MTLTIEAIARCVNERYQRAQENLVQTKKWGKIYDGILRDEFNLKGYILGYSQDEFALFKGDISRARKRLKQIKEKMKEKMQPVKQGNLFA